jgi:hypothetical protein
VSRSTQQKHFGFGLAVMAASLLFLGCAVAEPGPAGVSRRIAFSVVPVYPKSFEITAGGPRSLGPDKLKEAWQKKAMLVANGRRFKTSPLVVHDNESVTYGTYWPLRSRSVTGTITLTD